MEPYKISLSNSGLMIELSSHDKAWVEEKASEYQAFIDRILEASLTVVTDHISRSKLLR